MLHSLFSSFRTMIFAIDKIFCIFLVHIMISHGLRFNSLGGFMANRPLHMNIMQSYVNRFSNASKSPPEPISPSKSINFAKESSRFLSYFVTTADVEKIDQISLDSILLVSSSSFDEWKGNVSVKSLALYESINDPMKKFPGTKIIFMPDEVDGKAVCRNILFYNDKKLSYKTFDSVWSPIISKNRTYSISYFNNDDDVEEHLATAMTMSWAISSYRYNFLRTKAIKTIESKLIWPKLCDMSRIIATASAYTLMKDLSDTPALDLGPCELRQAAVDILTMHGVTNISTIIGVVELNKHNYSQIAAVGMAAASGREPCLVDARWAPSSDTSYPEIVIIGKGVVFDTGGLNIKSGGGMRNMKKDMSGAAQALATASMIIQMKLPVRMRLLLPIVENSISGIALRPGDVIRARNGKTTEITNTDAEGRLILADVLCAAVEDPNVALIVDYATLTGAARVALGNDLPAIFSNNDNAMLKLWKLSHEISDPMWMMPLWEPMRSNLKSSIADLVNAAEGGGGAITAALYLSEFIKPVVKSADNNIDSNSCIIEDVDEDNNNDKSSSNKPIWFHIDFMGTKNGVAEPQGMRSIYEYIKREIIPTTSKSL